ncbi:MAG TPA: PP2C family protein-serine/threonine phosphatase [Nocardioidaceae bacterium]|nr:PP2C family protein-serine/threonine phosphatase [Nocardioidaceae bacterium]
MSDLMTGGWMTSERAPQVLGAGLAALCLVTLVVIDIAIPGAEVVLVPLFALSPLIACAVLSARTTAAFAVTAVAMSVGAGWWDGTWGIPQQVVRVIDVTLISGAAVVVAAVRVRREERFARVVAIAEVAQRAILPTLPTRIGQVAVGARYLSAAQDAVVGGDLYDCYHSSAHVRFLVGDVRGKGIAAVEQAARVIRAFRQAAAIKAGLPSVAEDMSRYLAPFFDDEEFVTALLVDATDPARLTLVSCGHPQALLVKGNGSASLIDAPAGLPLGLGDRYDAVSVAWESGDRLLMYTDGLSEARDARGEFLEVPGLAPLLRGETVDEALEGALDAVRRHIPSGKLSDDLAVMLLENLAVPLSEPVYRGFPEQTRYEGSAPR